MRKGIKEAAPDTVLTPRFYTTDFDAMEEMFSLVSCKLGCLKVKGLTQNEIFFLAVQERNPDLPMAEFHAMLNEFRTDYNKTHFVRNESFKKAADNITGPARKIFIEFLERSCTAEFSGFLLYKELGRRLKKTNPTGAALDLLYPKSFVLLCKCLVGFQPLGSV